MTIHYDPDFILEARAFGEEQMLAQGTMYRKTGRTERDESTGETVPIYDELFTDYCKIADPSRNGDPRGRPVEVGEGIEYVLMKERLHLPVGDDDIHEGDEWVMILISENDDPLLLGKRYRITGVPSKSRATARRLDIEEV